MTKLFLTYFIIAALTACKPTLTEKNPGEIGAAFIDMLKKGDAKALANNIDYPLKRKYPIPPIKNKREFVKRYPEIFDTELVKTIVTSDTALDWEEIGWRGISFNNGLLWFNSYGTLFVINHHTEFENNLRDSLIVEERKTLHPSLFEYDQPKCIMKTSQFIIRVDYMKDETYRYASWPINKTMREKPDLVLFNGELILDGSGGNYYYQFINGAYTYRCFIWDLGDVYPGLLLVEQGEHEIVNQNATEVLY